MNQRVFNVSINGTPVLPNFDIVAAAGANNALVKSFTATAAAATLTVNAAGTLAIMTQPANQTATIGTTATFSAVASGTGALTYQWSKNGVAIPGATSASYTTLGTTALDNNASFSVTIANASSSTISAKATLSVSSNNPSSTTYPGFIGTSLNNNTRGAWQDNQIYVEVIGNNPANNGALSWVNFRWHCYGGQCRG